jgi:hypothetical protein
MAVVAFHHRYLGMQVDDRRMDDLPRVAAEQEDGADPHGVGFREAPWLCSCSPGGFPGPLPRTRGFLSAPQAQMLRTLAPDFPKVWFDTCAMTSVDHGLAEFIDACGPERLVLGTDPVFR